MHAPSPPHRIVWKLCLPDGRMNLDALGAYADELEGQRVVTSHEYRNGVPVTLTRTRTREEAYGLAIRVAQAEREANRYGIEVNAAWLLQYECKRRDAERIARTMTAEEIQVELNRRSFGTFAESYGERETADTYRLAQRLQAELAADSAGRAA